MTQIICYDISDPKRLRRVSRCLEKVARRIQKSVFLFERSKSDLIDTRQQLLGLVDPSFDRVHSWQVTPNCELPCWAIGENDLTTASSFGVIDNSHIVISPISRSCK